MRNALPLYLVVGAAGLAFVVWLFTSMARTGYANRILVTLVVCFALVGLAGLLGLAGRERERQR